MSATGQLARLSWLSELMPLSCPLSLTSGSLLGMASARHTNSCLSLRESWLLSCLRPAMLSRCGELQNIWTGTVQQQLCPEACLPSLMPILCFQGTSWQRRSSIQSASFKSTKPGYKHTLNAERAVISGTTQKRRTEYQQSWLDFHFKGQMELFSFHMVFA